MANTERQLITPTEAARMVGVDPRTVSNWVRRSQVPRLGFVVGGRVFIRRVEVERLLNGDCEATCAGEPDRRPRYPTPRQAKL